MAKLVAPERWSQRVRGRRAHPYPWRLAPHPLPVVANGPRPCGPLGARATPTKYPHFRPRMSSSKSSRTRSARASCRPRGRAHPPASRACRSHVSPTTSGLDWAGLVQTDTRPVRGAVEHSHEARVPRAGRGAAAVSPRVLVAVPFAFLPAALGAKVARRAVCPDASPALDRGGRVSGAVAAPVPPVAVRSLYVHRHRWMPSLAAFAEVFRARTLLKR
jgi:hypothetical protein